MRITATLPGSGTLGGVVANRTKTGPRLSARAGHTQPRTTLQTTFRARLGSAAAQWRALTASQQAAWDTLASATPWKDRLGQPITLSGYALFISQTVRGINDQNPPVPPTGTVTIEQDGTVIAVVTDQSFEQDGTIIAAP